MPARRRVFVTSLAAVATLVVVVLVLAGPAIVSCSSGTESIAACLRAKVVDAGILPEGRNSQPEAPAVATPATEPEPQATVLAEPGGTEAITEPVPVYLLEEVGLVNKTPAEFSESVEEGTDLSPRVLADTLALFTGGEVKMLAYNDQVSSSETEQVRSAAESADIAVVNFTETLPDGQDYLGWMTANLDAVSRALG